MTNLAIALMLAGSVMLVTVFLKALTYRPKEGA